VKNKKIITVDKKIKYRRYYSKFWCKTQFPSWKAEQNRLSKIMHYVFEIDFNKRTQSKH